jgi:folate-dependent phosphoribosylglycinamide formyltransferase PurN
VVAEDQWSEADHELSRRLGIMESTGRLTSDGRLVLEQAVHTMIDTQAIEIVVLAGFVSSTWLSAVALA